MQANPSHLEVVAPVVIGRVRAKQNQHNDTNDRLSVLGIVLHGDAAFAGQGIVAETFDFSGLRGYRTGGTIHIVVIIKLVSLLAQIILALVLIVLTSLKW